MVGDKTWEKGMVNFLSAFTRAQVHYFDAAAMEDALKWLSK